VDFVRDNPGEPVPEETFLDTITSVYLIAIYKNYFLFIDSIHVFTCMSLKKMTRFGNKSKEKNKKYTTNDAKFLVNATDTGVAVCELCPRVLLFVLTTTQCVVNL